MSKTERRDSSGTRVNESITAKEVLLIDQEGEKQGIVAIRDALKAAESVDMDLVEIAPNAQPPVCRIMDYGKFQFEQSKKRSQSRKKQKLIQVKEIKFRPVTEEGDYQVKLRNLKKFLTNGDKAKVTVRFRGRELAHQDLGMRILDRVKEDLKDLGQVEQTPKREGRQLVMVIGPLKSTK